MLRDKLEQRQTTLFANRELELNEMEQLLNISPLLYNLLHLSGIGGIGKSSLVQAFARRCRTRGTPVALVDARIPRLEIETLTTLQSQLRTWDKLTEFEHALRRYLNIQARLQRSSNVPDQIIKLATKGLTIVSQAHPLSNLAIQMVGPENVEAALRLLHQVLSKEESDFYLNAPDTLTKQFTHSLKKLAERKRTVLIFDSFERMANLSPWLANHVVSQLPENVLVILSGRGPLGPEWDQWRPLTRELPLTPFAPVDAEVYLRKRGIYNDKLIDEIVTFTNGLPLGIATCADLAEKGMTLTSKGLPVDARLNAAHFLVNRIVGGETPDDLRAALEICAVLRTFDEDVLSFMLQCDDVTNLYQELRRLSFVQTYEGRACLHDSVRDILCEQLRHHAPDRFARLNRRAADFYTQWQPSQWEVCLIEKLYHLLAAAPDEGFDFFANVYGEAERMYRLDLCAALLTEMQQTTLSPEHATWVRFYEGKLLFLHNQWQKAEALYKQLAHATASDQDFQAMVLVELGRTAAQRGQWPIAVDRFKQARAIWHESGKVNGEAQTLVHLANAYRLQGKWEAAQSSVETSLTIWKGSDRLYEIAYALNLLGDIHRAQGQWADAIACYTTCLHHRRTLNDRHGIGQTLRNLGDVYRLQARWLEATKCYQESLAIQREVNDDYEIARLLHSLGAIALLQHNPREALRNFSRSLKIRRSLGDRYRVARTLRSMADAYTALGDHDLAITSLEESRQLLETLNDEFGVGLTDDSLGMAWRAKGDKVRAQAAFESSLAIMQRNKNRYYEARVLAHLCELGQQIQNDELVLRYESNVADLDGVPGIDNWLVVSYSALAQAYLRLNKSKQATYYQQKAEEALSRLEAARPLKVGENG